MDTVFYGGIRFLNRAHRSIFRLWFSWSCMPRSVKGDMLVWMVSVKLIQVVMYVLLVQFALPTI